MILAHRGVMSKYPENTLDSFKEVRKYPNMGIELDVLLTKDNVVVCCHDNNLKRLTGKNLNVSDITFSQLCTLKIKKEIEYNDDVYKYDKENRFCSLEEVIEKFKDVLINIEIKTYKGFSLQYKKKLSDLVMNIINYRKLKKYMISSFDIVVVKYLKTKNITCVFICMDYIEGTYLKIINFDNYDSRKQNNIIGAYNVKDKDTNLKFLIMDY